MSFPSSPSNNQTAVVNGITYVYNASKTVWTRQQTNAIKSTTSSTPPSSPTVGDTWYDTTNDVIYRYTNDGSSNYWIDITSATVSSNASSGGTTSSSIGITSISIANSAYTILDDTAVSNTGGYIQLAGSNFTSTCSVIVGSNNVTSTTFVNTSILRAQVGAAAPGTYHVYVADSVTGSSAIKPNGLTYSSLPVWGTGTSLAGQSSGSQFNINLSASSDSNITYSNTSTLPTGTTLLSNGYFYGAVTIGSSTTYNFDVKATDVELQDTSRTFSLPIVVAVSAQYLVVAGGGGGGQNASAGGGGGGFLTDTFISFVPSTAYTVTVGSGGVGTNNFGSTPATNGQNSSISGSGLTTTAIGGGAAQGNSSGHPSIGGSGGGGSPDTAGTRNTYNTGAAGTAGQGYRGGNASVNGPQIGGGGGGGAGGAGGDNAGQRGGSVGGPGASSSITGSTVYYAGGGGSGGYCGGNGASGGIGGGGAGSIGYGGNGTSGTTNTGGGGGGAGEQCGGGVGYTGGSGGSGVVILRSLVTAASTTGSQTVTTDGSYNIYKFTSSGSITF